MLDGHPLAVSGADARVDGAEAALAQDLADAVGGLKALLGGLGLLAGALVAGAALDVGRLHRRCARAHDEICCVYNFHFIYTWHIYMCAVVVVDVCLATRPLGVEASVELTYL